VFEVIVGIADMINCAIVRRTFCTKG